jgi:hypothetical protein
MISWTVTILTGAIGSIIGAILLNWAQQYLAFRYLRLLFNLGPGELIFVVPHRSRNANSIMPRVAVENVLAINNILSILRKLGWKNPVRIKDAAHLERDNQKSNIITLGGSIVNPFTAQVFAQLPAKERLQFEPDPVNHSRRILRRGLDTIYVSGSYDVADDAGPEIERTDVAVFVKLRNPSNPDTIIIAIAGIRGIGTWGATDCIRKYAKEIFKRKQKKKTGDFLMAVAINYKNYDIVSSEVKDFIDLP